VKNCPKMSNHNLNISSIEDELGNLVDSAFTKEEMSDQVLTTALHAAQTECKKLKEERDKARTDLDKKTKEVDSVRRAYRMLQQSQERMQKEMMHMKKCFGQQEMEFNRRLQMGPMIPMQRPPHNGPHNGPVPNRQAFRQGPPFRY